MEEYNFKEVVNSLFSEEANLEYINLYLNDSNFKDKCNNMISEVLFEDFSNKIYDVDKCINFLNNVVSKELNNKPYLAELNIIINTINEYIEKNKTMIYYAKSEEQKQNLSKENAKLASMLFVISDEFTLKQDVDFDSEKKLIDYYKNKMDNDEPLSKEEVEELISTCLTCGFTIYDEEVYKKFSDYALKNILESDYEIDGFLYKKLFVYQCKEEICRRKKIRVSDINIIFNYDQNFESYMTFSPKGNTITINNIKFKKAKIIENFIGFFHEYRHYEQHNCESESLISFLIAKDGYLSDSLEGYYQTNYGSLFSEKEANYISFKYTYDFIKEKAPGALQKVKAEIYELSVLCFEISRKFIYRRNNPNEAVESQKIMFNYEDINILFDREVRKNRDLTVKVLMGNLYNKNLLLEYDLQGHKRNVFELLEDKDNATNHNLSSRCEIYNYLLYEEAVSFDYILENLKLFESEKNREKYGKYYKEAIQILKKKLIDYYSNELSKKSGKSLMNQKYLMSDFYDLLIDGLRRINIKGLNKDKNIEVYREKEEELRIAYKWLYNLINEIEEEHVKEVENSKAR